MIDSILEPAVAGEVQQRLLVTLERLLAIRAPTLKAALDEATHLIAEVLAAEKVDALLYDPTSESLVAVGTSDTPLGRRQHQTGLHRLPVANGGRLVAVYQTGTPHHDGHVDADPDELIGIRRTLGVRSTIAAAIDVDGERRGVFAVTSTDQERFSVADLCFCEVVARWIGLVVHRVELTERLTRDAAEQGRRAAADELIAVLAHDLRTPLTPAQGYVTLLQRSAQREGRERDARYLDQVAQSLDRLGGMIAAVLDVSRLDEGLFAVCLAPVDLPELVVRTVAPLRAPGSDIQVQVSDNDLVVQADQERLQHALENLVSNALAHGPAGIPVVVQVDREDSDERAWAMVRVRDAGPGIAPEVLPTLFDRFARGSRSGGLGLGLYLALGIAEAHGGTLTVDSQVGTGACFRVSLPLSAG